MIHSTTKEWQIAFHPACAGSIRMMLQKSGRDPADVLYFNDDLSVGPLIPQHDSQYIKIRHDWWEKVIQSDFVDCIDDEKTVSEIRKILERNEHIVCWCGPSAYEHLGLERLMYVFKEYANLIQIIDVPEEDVLLGSICIKGLCECYPETLLKLETYKRCLQRVEADAYAQSWTDVASNTSMIRVRKNNAYEHHSENYYDKSILALCSKHPVPSVKIHGPLLGKTHEALSLDFLLWRTIVLNQAGKLILTGNPYLLSEQTIRLP